MSLGVQKVGVHLETTAKAALLGASEDLRWISPPVIHFLLRDAKILTRKMEEPHGPRRKIGTPGGN